MLIKPRERENDNVKVKTEMGNIFYNEGIRTPEENLSNIDESFSNYKRKIIGRTDRRKNEKTKIKIKK